MVEIVCRWCKKAIKPRELNNADEYDTESYYGEIVCQECQSLLYVKLVTGVVRTCKRVEEKPAHRVVYDTEVIPRPDGTNEIHRVSE